MPAFGALGNACGAIRHPLQARHPQTKTEFLGEAKAGDGLRIGYLEQEPQLDPNKDVFGNVLDGVDETAAMLKRFEEIGEKFTAPLEDNEMNALLTEQGELQEEIDAANGWEIERTAEIAMDALRCPPGDAEVAKLSGGERRRVALCRLLLERPDMLLLDEPTNHLDAESVAWLERFLHDYEGTVVAVTQRVLRILPKQRKWRLIDFICQ